MDKSWELVSKTDLAEPGQTKVAIRRDSPYSYHERFFSGNRMGDSDAELIEAVLDTVRAELDPTNAMVRLQEDNKRLTQALEKANATLDETNQLLVDMQLLSLESADNFEKIRQEIDVIKEHIGMETEEESDEDTESNQEHTEQGDGGDSHDQIEN